MKILNKKNLKWWGDQKSEVWAFKQNGDWYLIKNKQNEPQELKKQKSQDLGKINWGQIVASSLIGAALAVGGFFLFLTFILLKNEI
tara:strand:+ start:200 stop:457 length:258 start_codon:yes stop_codon:yes gene_type:complete